MQTHIPALNENETQNIGNFQLLYASKPEGSETKFPKNAHPHDFWKILAKVIRVILPRFSRTIGIAPLKYRKLT